MASQKFNFNIRKSIFGLFDGDPERWSKTTTKTRLIFSKSLGLRPRSALGSSGAAGEGAETADGVETAEVDSCADSCWSGLSWWILSEIWRRDSPSRGFRLNIWLAFSSTSCARESKYIKEIGSREGGSAQRVLIRIRIQHFRAMRIRIQSGFRSGSRSGPRVLMIKNYKKTDCNFASLGKSQLQGKASTPQKKHSTLLTMKFLHFFYFVGHLIFVLLDPDPADQNPCGSMRTKMSSSNNNISWGEGEGCREGVGGEVQPTPPTHNLICVQMFER